MRLLVGTQAHSQRTWRHASPVPGGWSSGPLLQDLAQPRATALWNATPPESQPPVNWLHCSQLPPTSGQFMGSQTTSRVQFPILVSIGPQSALQPACSTEEGSSP